MPLDFRTGEPQRTPLAPPTRRPDTWLAAVAAFYRPDLTPEDWDAFWATQLAE